MSKKPKDPELKTGEAKYIATVKLNFNLGRLRPEGGDIIILGAEDIEAGVRVDRLLSIGALVPYESEEQAQQIRQYYMETIKPKRDMMRESMIGDRRRNG